MELLLMSTKRKRKKKKELGTKSSFGQVQYQAKKMEGWRRAHYIQNYWREDPCFSCTGRREGWGHEHSVVWAGEESQLVCAC